MRKLNRDYISYGHNIELFLIVSSYPNPSLSINYDVHYYHNQFENKIKLNPNVVLYAFLNARNNLIN